MQKDRVIWSNKNTDSESVQVGLLFMDYYKGSNILIEVGDSEQKGILTWFDSHNIILKIGEDPNGMPVKSCVALDKIEKMWVLKEKEVVTNE